MADTKLTALSAGTPALASLVYGVDDPAGTPVSVKYTLAQVQTLMAGGLTATAGGADADQSMAVNTLYVVDISGYSADRTYTLPAVAAAGDRCGIMLSVGDDAFELLITATSGDTLNTVAGGTEWSRLFIDGETVIFRCIVANTTWMVESDGRIPMYGKLRLTTQADGETANTVSFPTDFGGAWTVTDDNASLCVTATGRIVMRRACKALINVHMKSKDNVAVNGTYGAYVYVSGSEKSRQIPNAVITMANMPAETTVIHLCVVDDFVNGAYSSSAGAIGVQALSTVHTSAYELLHKSGTI